LSGAIRGQKIPNTPIPTPAIMFNNILTRLIRLRPQADADEAVHAWINEDGTWHNSSFELARGLDIIEYRGTPPGVFADTMPSFQRAEA
jgi:hypothetical protein